MARCQLADPIGHGIHMHCFDLRHDVQGQCQDTSGRSDWCVEQAVNLATVCCRPATPQSKALGTKLKFAWGHRANFTQFPHFTVEGQPRPKPSSCNEWPRKKSNETSDPKWLRNQHVTGITQQESTREKKTEIGIDDSQYNGRSQ